MPPSLHSNNGVLTVIDENDKVLRQRKLPNRIEGFLVELEPFREALQGVAVESTFNWYWLVDGLLANGYRATLVSTAVIQQYEGLKHSDDQYDAWWLAHMRECSDGVGASISFRNGFGPTIECAKLKLRPLVRRRGQLKLRPLILGE